MVDPLREIEDLVAFDGRGPGTDAERRAAVHLVERLRSLGRDAELEPTRIRAGWPLAHVIHAVLGIAGSLLSVSQPVIGLALALFAAVSTFGDLTGTFFLVRRLTPGRASQNVVSREDSGGHKPGLLVLTAHYDAARTGAVFGRRWLERRAVISKTLRRPVAPFAIFFWSLVAIVVCALLRLIGIDPLPVTVVQFVATVVLILAVPLLLDIALSAVVPGANDNASGVATALRLAQRFGGANLLQHFELMVLFPGAEEGFLLGMRSFVRRHKKELDPSNTVFLNIDTVGHGTVRWQSKSGFILPLAFHPTLIEMCKELDARGIKSRSITDAYTARAGGYPAMSIGCLNAMDYVPTYHQHADTPDSIDPEALERAFEFCSRLIELIDERIGRDLERDTPETILSEG
jgi:hypothetical protein